MRCLSLGITHPFKETALAFVSALILRYFVADEAIPPVTSSTPVSEFGVVSNSSLQENNYRRQLGGSVYNEYLEVCFGAKNSICYIELYEFDPLCDSLQTGIRDDFTHCICESGTLAMMTACSWCQMAYNQTGSYNLYVTYSSSCSAKGYTIAPIPASVISVQSTRNATMTVGRSFRPTGSATTGVISSFSTPRATGASRSAVVKTLSGGDLGAQTLATATSIPTSAQRSGGESRGGRTRSAAGWNTGTAALFSVIASWASIVFLL